MTTLLIPCRNEANQFEQLYWLTTELQRIGIINQVLFVDGNSTDKSAELAKAAGYQVLQTSGRLGKGENIHTGLTWLILQQPETPALVLDADIQLANPEKLADLVAAVTTSSPLVKATFTRVDAAGIPSALPGGRVTDLVARPLLAQKFPDRKSVV